ncbi:O-antigen ligase family protein [uncultured Winogradskyella sp.]|uniref:O-antigen ligase family protein n=1 Tax=uncultured Winogradskyella sp. TaxID=395353 RepID=UPI0026076814|nr:O-antigen ligase family protein [uncultured Winogradskyella sp.]
MFVTANNLQDDFYKVSKSLIWFFGFFLFLNIGYKNTIKERYVKHFFVVSIILLFALVIAGTTNEALFKTNRDYGASNFAYYLLFAFPYLFMFRNVSYRSVLFAVITIGVAISFKRGTMLSFVLIVAYLMLFSNLKGIAGKRFSKLFRVLIICVVFLVLYQVVFLNFDSYVDKFSDIKELQTGNIDDVGSGRGKLYWLPIERWLNSNPFNFIFGYGFDATPQFYPTTGVLKGKFYAHSDFVMLIHDYGIIGLSILISLFYRFFKYIKSSKIMTNKVPLVLLFIALLIKSIFSGFIIYEYSIYGFAVLGYIIGRQRRQLIEGRLHYDQQL